MFVQKPVWESCSQTNESDFQGVSAHGYDASDYVAML